MYIPAGMLEVYRRATNPMRLLMFWEKVQALRLLDLILMAACIGANHANSQMLMTRRDPGEKGL